MRLPPGEVPVLPRRLGRLLPLERLLRLLRLLDRLLDGLRQLDGLELPRLLAAGPGIRRRRGRQVPARLLDHAERGAQQGLDAAHVGEEPVALTVRGASDCAGIVMGFRNDQLRLVLGGLAHLRRRLLRRAERRSEQRLALLDVREEPLEVLQLVGELAALAPHDLETRRHVVEQLVDLVLLVAEQRAAEPHVPQLYGCVPHSVSSQCVISRIAITIRSSTISTTTATIGEKSIGPVENGMIRRQNRRYGSHTS